MSRNDSGCTIPLVRGLPLLGNVREIARNMGAFMVEQYLRHGPVFRVNVLNHQLTILAGPEANAFMQEDGHRYLSPQDAWQDVEGALGMDNSSLFGLDGEPHRIMRDGLRPGYDSSLLYRQMPHLIEYLIPLIATWPRDQAFAFMPQIKRLMASLLGYMATHQAPDAIVDDLELFALDLVQMFVLKTKPQFLRYLPRYVRTKATVFGLLQRIWAERRDTDPAQEPNFVDVVRAFQQKHPDLMTENDAMANLLNPFLGGMHPVANITAVMLFHILADPGLKQAVTAEADQAFATGMLTDQSLASMTQTRWTAMEVLRLYNPGLAQARTVVREFEFMGYLVPVGTQCLVAHTVTHFLPEFFPDPHRFDIERYASARREHAQPLVYVPYGLGPHACLGSSTADLLYLILITTIFHYFQLELQPPDQTLRMVMDPLYGPDRNFRIALTGERRPLV